MDRDTVFALAREAAFHTPMFEAELMRFAALIEDHLTWGSVHTCNPGCTKPACVTVRKAVEAEREACAAIARQFDVDHPSTNYGRCIARIIEDRNKE